MSLSVDSDVNHYMNLCRRASLSWLKLNDDWILAWKSINQLIKVICNARSVVHKLESEARAVASGRVLLMVIENVRLEASFESI